MSRNLIPWIILGVSLLMDLYCFHAVRNAFQNSDTKVKWLTQGIYIASSIFTVVYFLISIKLNLRETTSALPRYMFGILIGIIVSKIFLTLFLGIEDIIRLLVFIVTRLFGTDKTLFPSRREFLDKTLIGIATVPFIAFIYGMVKTAYDYHILRIDVPIPNLPKGLEGMKIVQISDIHSGSFTEIEPLKKAVETINNIGADLFVFTGDLVNNRSSEYTKYIDIFKDIKAPLGQFSILGNHDYGDYVEWDSEELKRENLQVLKNYHRDTNWDLLLNEHRIIERNGDKFALIGIENWGAKMHFHKYGNLAKAYQGTESIATKILLSHDPSHWDAQVRKQFQDIQLTMSGHTHGMQFGIDTKWLKFSPVQWVYKQWAGLYQEASQYLYVNRGFGFLAYPGRVGIAPEITVLTLKKA